MQLSANNVTTKATNSTCHSHTKWCKSKCLVWWGSVSVELFSFQSQSMDKSFIFSLENNMMTANLTTLDCGIRWKKDWMNELLNELTLRKHNLNYIYGRTTSRIHSLRHCQYYIWHSFKVSSSDCNWLTVTVANAESTVFSRRIETSECKTHTTYQII